MGEKNKNNMPEVFQLGHDQIDHEHSHLFNIIIDPIEANIEKNTSFQERAQLFFKAMEFHMHEEERLMVDCDYPKLKDHCDHHIQSLERLKILIEKNPPDIIQECMHEFVGHIIKADFDFALFLEKESQKSQVVTE